MNYFSVHQKIIHSLSNESNFIIFEFNNKVDFTNSMMLDSKITFFIAAADFNLLCNNYVLLEKQGVWREK